MIYQNLIDTHGERGEAFKAPSHAEAWGSVEKRELNRFNRAHERGGERVPPNHLQLFKCRTNNSLKQQDFR